MKGPSYVLEDENLALNRISSSSYILMNFVADEVHPEIWLVKRGRAILGYTSGLCLTSEESLRITSSLNTSLSEISIVDSVLGGLREAKECAQHQSLDEQYVVGIGSS